ncbi:MAG: N-acetyltransferase [Ignavibacteriales bacterium]|nr:N-acetyltransferase [Ignavibacteriales bacterium]
MEQIEKKYHISQFAEIEDDVEIDENTNIKHFSKVMSGSRIGKNCVIGKYVFIGNDVKIGDQVKIEDDVTIYEDVCLGIETEDESVDIIDSSSKYPKIHNKFVVKTIVKEGALIGAESVIKSGSTIGKFSFVRAGALVKRDIPDYAIVEGDPAEIKGWISEAGRKLKFNENGIAYCPKAEKRYKLKNNLVSADVK